MNHVIIIDDEVQSRNGIAEILKIIPQDGR